MKHDRQQGLPTGSQSSPLTRRQFLGRAAGAAAAPWIIPSSALGADGTTAPSARITAALIGKGVMGNGHLRRLLGDTEIQLLAVCEADAQRLAEAKQLAEETYGAGEASGKWRGCAAVRDYRQLLGREDLDAVVIATPDHWHTPMSIDFARAGKDIYCEKPISLSIAEGRRLVEEIRRRGRIFQTGTQYRSIPVVRKVCAFIRAGGLGRIKTAFVIWNNLENWMRGAKLKTGVEAGELETYGKSYAPINFPLPGQPVPTGLDWEMWTGPAPLRPYNNLFHTNPPPGVVPWCFCEDFGAASVTWHHSHSADIVQWALGMEESGPVELIHPVDGPYPTLTCRYANGTLLHHVDNLAMVRDVYKAVPADVRLDGAFGGVFIGERGWLSVMGSAGEIQGAPELLFKEIGLKSRTVVIGTNNHHQNWLDCIRTRQRPSTDEELGHRSASLGHLAIIAYKLGRSLQWDSVREAFIGDEQANRMRGRTMRAPWGQMFATDQKG